MIHCSKRLRIRKFGTNKQPRIISNLVAETRHFKNSVTTSPQKTTVVRFQSAMARIPKNVKLRLARSIKLAVLFHGVFGHNTSCTAANISSGIQQGQQTLNTFRETLQAEKYVKILPPNFPQFTNVTVSLWHGFLRAFDQVEETVQLSTWIRFLWYDERLKQPIFDVGSDNVLLLSEDDVWTPSVRIVERTYAVDGHFLRSGVLTVNLTTGLVKWAGYLVDTLSCPVATRSFPFDRQECSLSFLGSGMIQMCYEILPSLQYITTGQPEKLKKKLFETGSWRLPLDTVSYNRMYVGDNVEVRLDTAGNGPLTAYDESALVFTVLIDRKSEQYVYTWIALPILLSISSVIGLYVGCETGERFSFGGAVIVTLTLMQSELRNTLPVGVDGYPILGLLYMSLTVSLVVATLTSSLPECLWKRFGQASTSSHEGARQVPVGAVKFPVAERRVLFTLSTANFAVMSLNLAIQVTVITVTALLWLQAI